ncbi:MAG: DUF559 domain-containing protein [Actinomycetes bacterium]
MVTRPQLLQAGFSKDRIRTRVRRGQLHPVFPGVYAVGRRDLPRDAQWSAALLHGGDEAALAVWTAAACHAIRRSSSSRPHIVVPRPGGRESRDTIVIHRCPTLAPQEVTEIDGVRVTTLARTMLDIAAATPRQDILRKMLVEAETLRIFDLAQFDELLARRRGDRGLARLRLALQAHRDIQVFSGLEVDFVLFCETYQLPSPPVVNGLIEGYLVDFAWPACRVIVETDTPKFHGEPTSFEDDRIRDAELHARGWRVLRFTRYRLHTEPARVARILRRTLGRSPGLTGP